ncbi:unnamed protein product [Moneuplotes crassus]|uniref:Uncharacterized protein n=1 Tax=Euplotes crassus TaxID=5936 RepID=A0AAD1X9Z2_EUPCR|nr:unnamed protein product [Moneuplotes crassus]
MSKHNHNPIPQDSETVNDMFNKGENPKAKALTIEPKLREKKQPQPEITKEYKAGTPKKLSNELNKDLGGKHGPESSINNRASSIRSKTNKSTGNTSKNKQIREGLDEIDQEIEYIDSNLPDEVLEEDDELSGLVNSNKILRDKVNHLSFIVENAIEKAASLRKQINTHRKEPEDEELKSKLKEINKYQKAIMKLKYPRKKEDYKTKEIKDEIKILNKEIKELEENQIQSIKRQNQNRTRAYEEIAKGNGEKNLKVITLKSSLQQEKEIVAQLEQESKENEANYEIAMKQLRSVNTEYRSLVDKRIALTSNTQTPDESEVTKEDRMISDIQKKKIIKRIANNKLTQIKMKVKAQKKVNIDIDKEIIELKSSIQEKLKENEQMSKRAKEMKGMFVQRPNDSTVSATKAPPSPIISEEL